jgi:hypothetical protein
MLEGILQALEKRLKIDADIYQKSLGKGQKRPCQWSMILS